MGSSWDTDADKEARRNLKLEFNAFHTGTGTFSLKFDDDYARLSDDHTLTMAEVSSWVKQTGGHEARIAWYEVNAPKSLFFLEVAKPLLSVRITGSMTVERVAKPLKNSVLTKDRSKLSTGKSEMLLRAGLNLRFLQDSREKNRGSGSY